MAVQPVAQNQGVTGENGDLAAQFSSILDALKKASPAGGTPDSMIDSIESGTDGDNDKQITANELAQYMNIPLADAENFVKAFNSQGEGTPALDTTEFGKAYEAQQAAGENTPPENEQPGEGQQPGESQQSGGGQQPGESEQALSDLVKLMTSVIDANGDGQISPEELENFVKKYDKNGDGQLDKKELADGLKAEAKNKGMEVSDLQIDTLLASADSVLTAASTDGKEGLGGEEISKILSTSAEAEG